MARLRRATVAKQQGPVLLACMESWLLAVESAGRSPATLASYRDAVTRLAEAVGNPPVEQVAADDVRRWLAEMRRRGLSANTLSSRFRGARRFFGWVEAEGLIAASPMQRLEAPKVPLTEPPGYSDDELRRLVNSCDTRTPTGARDRAIFLTLYGTGLRASELIQLRKDDVMKRGAGQVLRVLGKGGRERLISLTPTVREAIALYLLRRGEDDDPALWLGERGPLCTSGVRQICQRRGRQAGVGNCHPHRFRNTALSAMLDAGMDRGAVMRIAGHATEAMLRRYTGYAEQRRANEALQAAGHVERIDWRKKRSPRR